MNTFKRNRLFAAAALAAATFTVPALAHAGNYSSNSYEDCKRSDTEAQIIGGVLGALAGGVLGNNIAGGGAQTEGSVIGVAAGAAAGIAIANKDCKKRTGVYTTRTSDRGYATPRRTRAQTVSYNGHNRRNRGYNSGYSNRSYGNQSYGSRSYGYSEPGFGGFQNVRQVRNEINRLEDRRLNMKKRLRYGQGNPRRLEARLDANRDEIKRLRKIKKRFDKRNQRRDRNRNSRRDYGYSSHYHGADICYSNH